MLKKYTGKFYCFSPPVMLATFLFEFGSVFYILWRYKMSTLVRLVTVMLLALGTFQLSEYMICGGLGIGGAEWARLGYVSITLLPAVGMHMIAIAAGKKVPLLIGAAYASMAAFAVYFAFLPGAINSHECRPNYAVFNIQQMNVYFYSAYYYGWLVAGTLLSWHWAKNNENAKALLWLTTGYLLFMLPTVTVNIMDPSTLAGIPSIMCGFAVLLAITMVGRVLPLSRQPLKQTSTRRREKSRA
jgi:hypothetical protein